MSEETSVLNALECSMTIHDMDKKIRDQVVVRPGAYYDDFEEPDSFGCCKHEVLFWLEKIYKLEIYLESSNKKEFFQLFFFIRENLMSIFNKQLSFGLELYYSISQMFLIYINRHGKPSSKKRNTIKSGGFTGFLIVMYYMMEYLIPLKRSQDWYSSTKTMKEKIMIMIYLNTS